MNIINFFRRKCKHIYSTPVYPGFGSGKNFDKHNYYYCRVCRKYYITTQVMTFLGKEEPK